MNAGKINKKVLILLVAAAVIISCAACFVLYKNMQRCVNISLPAEVTAASDDLMYEITECGQDEMMTLTRNGMAQVGGGEDYLTVEGWAGVYGEETKVFNTAVLLRPVQDKEQSAVENLTDGAEYIKLKTTFIDLRKSPDVDNGDVSFAHGWFVAKVRKDALRAGEKYQVCLWYRNDGHNELVETEETLEA